MPQKLTTCQFVEKAKQIHGDRFDYGKTEYKTSFVKVVIGCREHNLYFSQVPQNHLNGHIGCPICVPPKRPIDLTGMDVGTQHVISLSHKEKTKTGSHLCWKIECKNCGYQTVKRTSHLMCLHRCRNCFNLPKGESGLKRVFAQYKFNAKKFNRKFELSINEFRCLTITSCYYCGRMPCNEYETKNSWGNYVYNGIDRIDSSKDYTSDNVRTCCKFCNRAKYALPEGEFINHLKHIVTNAKIGSLDHLFT